MCYIFDVNWNKTRVGVNCQEALFKPHSANFTGFEKLTNKSKLYSLDVYAKNDWRLCDVVPRNPRRRNKLFEAAANMLRGKDSRIMLKKLH